MNPLISIALAGIITIIGALPLGLVNLTVLDVSYRNGKAAAMQVAHGAAWIEVLFGFTALLAGGLISHFTRSHQVVQSLVLVFPAVVGLVFILKKSKSKTYETENRPGFFKGVFLNLISIQVLLYWLFAMTYVNTRWHPDYNILSIALFAVGIWAGKMGVLWVYALFSGKILSKYGFIARHINHIIGAVLLGSLLLQFLK